MKNSTFCTIILLLERLCPLALTSTASLTPPPKASPREVPKSQLV